MDPVSGAIFFILAVVLIGFALVWAGYTPAAEPKEDPGARLGDAIQRQARQLDAAAYYAKRASPARIDLAHRGVPLTLTMDGDGDGAVVSIATALTARARVWPSEGLSIVEAPRGEFAQRLSRGGATAQATGDAAFDAAFEVLVEARAQVAWVGADMRGALLALRDAEGVVSVALSSQGLQVDVEARALAADGALAAVLDDYERVRVALIEAQAAQLVGVEVGAARSRGRR